MITEEYFHAGLIDGKHLEIFVRTTDAGTYGVMYFDGKPFALSELKGVIK